MFKLEIKTSNSAFEEPYKEQEIARILKKIADDVVRGNTYGNIMDINGNKVGKWELEE